MYKAIAANKRNTVFITAVFLLIIGGLGWLAGYIYDSYSITVFVVVIAAIYALIQFFAASHEALALNGAREIDKSQSPELFNLVENLTIATGLPMPKVYIIDDPAPNAFATGRNPNNSMVAVTSGLLEIMDKRELEAVLAHEMSHIKNYDILLNMVVFGLVSAIVMLCDLILRLAFGWGGRRGNSEEGEGGGALMLIGLVAVILAPIVAALVQLAVSRQREYLADANGALMVRDPEGLAMALEKLKTDGRPMRRQNTSTAHLFFTSPLKENGFFAKLFSTHPPLDERIARLRANENRM
ncbi:MAG: M48 family metalloprotease [Candidatus Nomurabacteria bacterium]|nr:M48 family metalloprotease [Candidatus Nomurabacteria bacterium]